MSGYDLSMFDDAPVPAPSNKGGYDLSMFDDEPNANQPPAALTLSGGIPESLARPDYSSPAQAVATGIHQGYGGQAFDKFASWYLADGDPKVAEQNHQTFRNADKPAEIFYPNTVLASGVATGLAMPYGKLSQGAGLGTRMAEAAIEGGIQGAASAPTLDSKNVGENAAGGGAFGAGATVAGRALQALGRTDTARAISARLQNQLERSGARDALNFLTQGRGLKETSSKVTGEQAGARILQDDIDVRLSDKPESLRQRVINTTKQKGSEIGKIRDQIDAQILAGKSSEVSTDRIAADIQKNIIDQTEDPKIQKQISKYIEKVLPKKNPDAPLTLSDAVKKQKVATDKAGFAQDNNRKNATASWRGVYGAIANETKYVARKALTDMNLDPNKYDDLMGDYHILNRLKDSSRPPRKAVEDNAAKTLNTAVKLAKGATVVLWALDRYGPQTKIITKKAMVSLLNTYQKEPASFGKFRQIIDAAAKKGPKAMLAVHMMLLDKEPEYKQIADSIQ